MFLKTSAAGLLSCPAILARKNADTPAVWQSIIEHEGSVAHLDMLSEQEKTALAEWNSLPEDAKAKTADWARAAEARLAADELVARLRSEALSRLGREG